MKTSLALLLFLSISFASFGQKSALSPTIRKFKDDTVLWKKDSLLVPANFKLKSHGSDLGYTTTCIFLYPTEVNGQMVFSVEALFIKSKSFLTKNSDYVLRHEQLHFDICELYARKLRKMLSDKDFKKVNNVSQVVQNMYNKATQDCIREEEKYDTETNHGTNAARQQEWVDKVKKELDELDAYSSTDVNTVK